MTLAQLKNKLAKAKYQFGLKRTRTVFDAISIGEGYGGRYIMGKFVRKKPEKRKIALIDPLYSKKDTQLGVTRLTTDGFTILPKNMENAILEMKKKRMRTKRITIDMPGAVNKEQFGMKTHLELYKFSTLFKEAKNILVPNGRIFVTTSDAKLCMELITEAQKHGLKIAAWPHYNKKETPNAVNKSYWIGRHMEEGMNIFRMVLVLPLTQTHTKAQRRKMSQPKK